MSDATTRLRRKARALTRRGAFRGRTAVLFGASVLAAQVMDELHQQGVTVKAVIDNNPEKIGRNYHGLTVKRPEELLAPHSDEYVVVVVAFAACSEMLEQLRGLGYRQGRQAFAIVPGRFDDSLRAFLGASRRALRGRIAYRRLTGGDKSVTLLVAPYAGTGDIYLIGLYLREYLERAQITDYRLAVASNACAQVARMMGEERVAVVDSQVLDAVVNYSRLIRADDHQVMVLNDGWATAPTEWLRGYKGLNFERMFRHAVFGLPDQVTPRVPTPSAANSDVLGLFAEQELSPGATVVLSPYANTLFRVPDNTFWTAVADRCAELGLTVCTNCAGAEQPIAGTRAARFPLALAPDFVEAAGYFVGVRSGLCDVVSCTSSRKVVLYDDSGRFYKSSFHEYFSLEGMGLDRNLVEIEYGGESAADTVETIMEGLR